MEDTLQDFRSSTGRLPAELRTAVDDEASLSAAFWDVLRDTTGIFPVSAATVARKAQQFNKSLKRPKEPAICTHRPPPLTQDDYDAEELDEKQALQDERDLASAEMDIVKFELRMQQEEAKKNKKDLKQSLSWSSDAEALYNQVTADQRLSKNSELHTREFIVAHFRHLILSKMKVRRIDAGVRDFANLQELNVSQNAIRVLEHLPVGLKVLNAYANAVDDVQLDESFHELVFLGLGYNRVSSMQTLQNLLPRLGTLGRTDPTRRPIRLPAGEAVRVPTQFAAASLADNGVGSKLTAAAASEEWVAGRVLAPSVGPDGTPNQADARDNQTCVALVSLLPLPLFDASSICCCC